MLAPSQAHIAQELQSEAQVLGRVFEEKLIQRRNSWLLRSVQMFSKCPDALQLKAVITDRCS